MRLVVSTLNLRRVGMKDADFIVYYWKKKKEPVLKSRDLGLCHSYLWWPKGLLASAPALARFNTQCRADSVVWLLVQLFLEVRSP